MLLKGLEAPAQLCSPVSRVPCPPTVASGVHVLPTREEKALSRISLSILPQEAKL